jgi:hypothetical protein
MPKSEFEAEILENEVVIVHMDDGHIYHFPILPRHRELARGRYRAEPEGHTGSPPLPP